MSRKFKPFSNKNEDLVIQFSVKHEQNIDCGGGYVKIFDCKLDQKDMHGETPYEIMFGKNSLIIIKAEPKSHWSYHMWVASAIGTRKVNLTYALAYHSGIPVTRKDTVLFLVYYFRYTHTHTDLFSYSL